MIHSVNQIFLDILYVVFSGKRLMNGKRRKEGESHGVFEGGRNVMSCPDFGAGTPCVPTSGPINASHRGLGNGIAVIPFHAKENCLMMPNVQISNSGSLTIQPLVPYTLLKQPNQND